MYYIKNELQGLIKIYYKFIQNLIFKFIKNCYLDFEFYLINYKNRWSFFYSFIR